MSRASLGAVLRIARRDALRHKGRSALIVAMIAIPVMGLGAADVIARTMQLSPNEAATRNIGAADVGFEIAGGRIGQAAPLFSGYGGRPKYAVGAPAYEAKLAMALRVVGAKPGTAVRYENGIDVAANSRQAPVSTTALSFGNPLIDGIASLASGRVPRTATEVAITPHLATRLSLGIGGHLTSPSLGQHSDLSFVVTGFMRNPRDVDRDGIYVTPSSRLTFGGPTVLAATTHPVTWAQLQQLNRRGVVVESRYVDNHLPKVLADLQRSHLSPDRVGVATVAIGLAILEVVLLAGAAFAVGARRQRRDLALVAAAGGDSSNVVGVVMGSGLVLGVAGGVIGALAGIGVGRLALGSVAQRVGRTAGHFDVRPLELLAIVAIGVVTGVIATVLPARFAVRDSITAALAGRRGAVGTRRRIPAIGLVMIAVGFALCGEAAIHLHFRLILLGAVLAELGFVACAPTVVGLLGRLARHLPLAPRLAVRDASRNRSRTGPAVAAVMAAISGSVAVSAYFVSILDHDRSDFVPNAQVGQLILKLPLGGQTFASDRDAAMAVLRQDLDVSRIIRVPTVNCVQASGHCHYLEYYADNTQSNVLAVGGPALLRTITGRADATADAALSNGKIVAFSGPGLDVRAQYQSRDRKFSAPTYRVDLGSRGSSVSAIMTPDTARRLHVLSKHETSTTYLGVFGSGSAPSSAAVDRAFFDLPPSAELIVGQPYDPGKLSVGLIALALAAGIVTIGATAISVGLSMAESKPDLVTLAAVGGPPWTRRLLVASQAGTVAVVGAVLGTLGGLVPAWAVLRANHDVHFVMPWTTIVVLLLGLPVLAMTVTTLFAGSRLTLDRRLT